MKSSHSPQMQLLLEAPVVSMLFRLALPNLVAVTTMTCIIFADAKFIGQLGTTALASLAVVFPFQSLMQMMAAGAIGGGITSSVARALGSGDRFKAEEAAWHGLIIIGVMSLIYTLVLGVFCKPIFSLLGATEEVLEGSVLYSRILFGGALVGWLFFLLSALLRAIGEIPLVSRILIISSLVQIMLSGALTLGWGPFPSVGISGPASATLLCHATAGAYMLATIMRGKVSIRLMPYSFNIRAINDIMKVGGVGLLNSTAIAFTIVIVTGLVGRYGTEALAGYGLGSRLEIMLIPIAFGIGGVLTAAVGANFGGGKYNRARNIAWIGFAATFVATGIIGIIATAEPSLWLERFTTNPKAYSYGALYLSFAAPFYGLFGGGQTLYFASQGTGRMLIPVTVSISRLLLVATVGIFSVKFSWDISVIFGTVGAGLAIIGAGNAANMFSTIWRQKRAVE
ncbi:MAG: MATE family efflux transporter [SAR202 cluster bacterium]|nr:MATE family efflux transporter [SAR202 cluster bacterium]